MSLEEIKSQVDGLGRAWEEFKAVNDARLKEVETKKAADPLYDEQLSKLNSAIDEHKGRLEQITTALNRAPVGAETKAENKNAPYSNAFLKYVRRGDESGFTPEVKALSVGSDPDGGYWVTPQMSSDINTIIFETSPMRQLASIETISTDSLDVMDDVNEASGGWTTEAGSVSDTNTPQIGKRNIVVHEIYAQPKATQKLIDDASVNVEAWLSAKISDIFARTQNTAFISGTGVGKPRGILTYAAGTSWGTIQQVTSGSAGAVTSDGLIGLFYALKSDYAAKASFLMNRTVVQTVRTLKHGDGTYIWQPGLQAGQPDSLLGAPVYMASDMPTASANSLSVAFGDFKRGYKIVDRIGIRTLRDPFTDKPFVKFYSTSRVGGDVMNFEAIKLLKLA